MQDARGNWTNYGYDARNRLLWANDPLYRDSDGYTVSFSYDPAGNKLSERRANNQLITFDSYDPMNRLTQKTERRDGNTVNNLVTQWSWYLSGALHTMTDPRGKVYTYGFDLMNRKTSLAYPIDATGSVRQEGYDCDLAGNLWRFHNRAGATQTFQYDNRSRPAFFSWDNTTMARTTTYDAASRVTRVSVYDGDVDFTYNENNQVLTDKQTNKWTSTARTVTNTYDDDGDRLTLGYPSGNNYTFDYSGRDQLQTIIDTANPGAGNIVQYTYDTVGNRTARINRYNTRTDYGPGDALNRIGWLQHTFANGQTARFDYGFDAVSRRKYEQRDSGLADGYGYDLAGEVTGFNRNGTLNTQNGSVSGASSVNTLVYDANGNRTSQVLNGATTSYTGTSDVNQYGSINGATLGYDGDANLSAYNGWTYSYDSQNRLIAGSNSGSNTQLRFYYDGLNRQIMRDVTVNGTLTRMQFVYDGWNLIQEHNGAGTLQACYLHGAGTDELLSRFGGTSALVWYHGDGRGNVARLSDGSGNVTERYTYGLGGAPTITDPSGGARTVSWCNNRFLFQGRDYIKEAGLYDYRNRFYHPVLNRFLQPDPIGFAGDPSNTYRYTRNDAVNGSDPTGFDPPIAPRQCQNDCGQTPVTASFSAPASPSARFSDQLSRSGLGGHRDSTPLSVLSGVSFNPGGSGVFNNSGERAVVPTGGFSFLTGTRGGGGSSGVAGGVSQVVNWAQSVASAATMLGRFASGTGPQVQVFDPDSVESADMRSDPMVWVKASEAYASATGVSTVRTFSFPVGPITAGYHPIRQFVGSYNVEIRNGQAVVMNRTSLWSALGHLTIAGAPDRSESQFGGNTYQAYIIGPYP